MREFEDRFLSLGIPYRVIGGPRFYERAEIRDAMAYLRLVAQGDDDLAFERIVNKPKRGIGDASVQRLHHYARARQIPLLTAAREIADTDEVPPKARKSLAALAQDFARWTDSAKHIPHTDLAEMVLDECGYTEMLKLDKSPEAPGRLDNLKELVRSMEEFETLGGFLEHVSLVMDVVQNESDDKVNLMTMHAAKGLEFDTVFLPGWEEGLFPSQRTMDENGLAGLEEERRLAYVCLTRAKKRVRLSFAANRRIHGSWQSSLPSRFISELPQEHLDAVVDEGFYGGYSGFRDNAGSGRRRNLHQRLRKPGLETRTGQSRGQRRGAHAPADDRGAILYGADLRSQRHALRAGRPRVPSEIRLWPCQLRRRQQADGRVRPCRSKRVIDTFVCEGVSCFLPHSWGRGHRGAVEGADAGPRSVRREGIARDTEDTGPGDERCVGR